MVEIIAALVGINPRPIVSIGSRRIFSLSVSNAPILQDPRFSWRPRPLESSAFVLDGTAVSSIDVTALGIHRALL